METRIDPITGEEFYPARRNQKFASAENRILFNNDIAWQYRNEYNRINATLRNNHKVLLSLLEPNETLSFSKDFLKGLGYDMNFLTHFELSHDKPCMALYEFIFINMDQADTVTVYRQNNFKTSIDENDTN